MHHLLTTFGHLERDLLALAESLPAEHYASLPLTGNFAGARSFGNQLRHLATLLQITSAMMWQQPSPVPPGANDNGPELVGKDAILAYTREALAQTRNALSRLNPHTELETIPTYFGPQRRIDLASDLLAHSYNHYGQMVVLARIYDVNPSNL